MHPAIISYLLPFLLASMMNPHPHSSSSSSSSDSNNNRITVSGLYRYAVKGLSGDVLNRVEFTEKGQAFPDDRRFAMLLLGNNNNNNEWKEGEWLHKENFLCAFSDPEFLAQYESSYRIILPQENEAITKSSIAYPHDSICSDCTISTSIQRLFTLRHRATGKILLDSLNLQLETDRQILADYFSQASGKTVQCITSSSKGNKHNHQFGNTSSGYKQRKDTRTVHIINQATIDDMVDKCQVALQPTRFRPNIVLCGPPAWSEFDWIGKKQLVDDETGLTLTLLSKTVRCKGVSVDPQDLLQDSLDIPGLLVKHFPQYGPYLGVYAVVDAPGSLELGSTFTLQDIAV